MTDGLGIDLSAGLHLAIGDLTAEMQAARADAHRRAQLAAEMSPIHAPVQGSATTDATGLAVFSCGRPSQGRLWQVRLLVVGGISKGTARFYSSASAPITTPPQTLSLFDARTTWSIKQNGKTYSTGQIVIQATEQLWCMVTGATATTGVVVSGRVDDFPLAAYRVSIPV